MDSDSPFDRRTFLRASGGVAFGALLAGCTEGDGGDGDEPADDGEPAADESGEEDGGTADENGGEDGAAGDQDAENGTAGEEDGATGDQDGEDGGNETDGEAGDNETDGEPEENDPSDSPGGSQVEVIVGPDGDFVFEPEELTVEPETTVRWIWESDTHNIAVLDQPDASDWEGHIDIENAGFEYEHVFDEPGEYHYVCDPHQQQGMEGWVTVQDGSA